MDTAVSNLFNSLKPGGTLLFRDYAQGDLAQTRFKADSQIEENLFYRADGTLSYFFSQDFLRELFERAGFNTLQMDLIEKKVVNRKQGVEMHRIFIQAKFGRPLGALDASKETVQDPLSTVTETLQESSLLDSPLDSTSSSV